MKKYKVSVIVPVYNAEKYLRKCLNSLLSQTLADIEIIVINDGSTDKSLHILQEYTQRYNNITLISQANHGLYYSRKIGLQHVHGDFIGWVDADDFVDSNMYKELYDLAIKSNADVSYCNYNFYPKKPKTKEYWFRPFKGEKNVDFIERNSQPWNKIVKKTLLDKLNIGDLFQTCFDEAYIKVLLYCQKPVYTEKKLYYYRVTNNSMSSSYTNISHYISFINASKKLKLEMLDLCKKSSYWNDYFNYRVIYYMLLSILVSANAESKKSFHEQKKALFKEYPEYYKNIHIKNILVKNFGRIKYIFISQIIPMNYWASKNICKLVFKT